MIPFDAEWFQKTALDHENGLMDRKSQLYVVYGEGSEKGAEKLVTDMIALANTGRERGQRAFLMLGVANDLTKETDPFLGIDGQCSREPAPSGWDTWTLEHQQIDFIERSYQEVMAKYVTPHLNFRYVPGILRSGRLVAYIAIDYTNTDPDTPFEAKEGVGRVRAGDSWRRIGERNLYVPPGEKSKLTSFDAVPYVSSRQWEECFQELLTYYAEPFESQIPTQLVGSATLADYDGMPGAPLPAISELPPVTLLLGDAGAGKTTLLKRLMVSLSDNLLTNLRSSGPEEKPVEPIPIYVDVSGRHYSSAEAFRKHIIASLDRLRTLDLVTRAAAYSIIQKGEYSFVILVDGLDELEPGLSRESLASVREVLDTSPGSVRFVLAGRSVGVPQSWRAEYSQVVILPVGDSEIATYLHSLLRYPKRIVASLQDDPNLRDLANSPLGLEKVVELWRDWEREMELYAERMLGQASDDQRRYPSAIDLPPAEPTRAQIVEAIVDGVLRHDQMKGCVDNIYEYISRLADLALSMRVREQRFATIPMADTSLGSAGKKAFCALGFIKIDGPRLMFSSSLLLDYFTAYRLRELVIQSTGQESLTWQTCAEMLEALVSDFMPPLIHSYAKKTLAESSVHSAYSVP